MILIVFIICHCVSLTDNKLYAQFFLNSILHIIQALCPSCAWWNCTDSWSGLTNCPHMNTHSHTQFPLQWSITLPYPILSLCLGRLPAQPSLPSFLSLFRSGSLCVYSVHAKPSLTILRSLNQVAGKCAVMSLFPLRGGIALWGSATLREVWWQSGTQGLCKRRNQHHLSAKFRTTEDKNGWGAESLENWDLVVSAHPLYSLLHARRDTLSPCLSLLPSLFAPLSDAGVVNSRTLLDELHGGTGRGREPRYEPFSFLSFIYGIAFITLHGYGYCKVPSSVSVNSFACVDVFLHLSLQYRRHFLNLNLFV